jgi:hypothetical protein
VIDRDQGDQQEKEPLHNFSYPDTTWTKDAYTPAKQSNHTMTSGKLIGQSVVSEFGGDTKAL